MDAAARRALARRLAAAGVRACDASRLLASALSAQFPNPSTAFATSPRVIAAGKAAGPMLEAYLAWARAPGEAVGVATAPVPLAVRPPGIRTFVGGHPHPTEESAAAGAQALACAASAGADDCLVVLLSGGASALLAAAAPGVSLDDKVRLTRFLLPRGVPIDGLNAVRKHLSAIKGGQLAAATLARVFTFALSDVTRPVDDDPATIGSGPTVADPTTFAQAVGVLDAAGVEWTRLAPRAAEHLRAGLRGEVPETPKPGDARLVRASYRLIGNRSSAAGGASDEARRQGFEVVTRASAVEGEARTAATLLIDEALAAASRAPGPLCYVATGETTVTVRGQGRGGRNQELALAAALDLARRAGPPRAVTIVSVGTDGVDGPTDAAGAVADETTLARAAAAGLAPEQFLARNDSHPFFDGLGDLIVTGPTGTNVGDVMIVLVWEA